MQDVVYTYVYLFTGSLFNVDRRRMNESQLECQLMTRERGIVDSGFCVKRMTGWHQILLSSFQCRR